MPTSCVFIKKKAFPRWKEIHKISFTRPLLPGRRNDLADDEREKKHKAPAALYTGLLYSGGPVFPQVYLTLSLLQRQSLSPDLEQKQKLSWKADYIVISLTDYSSLFHSGVQGSYWEIRHRVQVKKYSQNQFYQHGT